jgi:hypothetical protein
MALRELETVAALRYVQPLREGGSLPAVVDTDRGLFVTKFRGAGQGPKALVAELLVGRLAAALGLGMPELVLVGVAAAFGRAEPDPEIQDLLRASRGLNVGLRYLEGAFNYDPLAAGELVDARWAAGVVWLDAVVSNPDRSHRNPNLMVHDDGLWLIDHGAALYHHHDWSRVDASREVAPPARVEDHVLLDRAAGLAERGAELAARVDGPLLDEVVHPIPDAFLEPSLARDGFASTDEARARYRDHLLARVRATPAWMPAVEATRRALTASPGIRTEYRR